MKTFCIVIAASLLIMACKSEKAAEQTKTMAQAKTLTQVDSTKRTVFVPPKLEENYYRDLFKFQQEIKTNPQSREKKERYIFNAYFPENNTLISFGSARKTNPSTMQAIPYPLQKRAALTDAKRWATYGLLWINNDFQPDFGRIQDIHAGEAQQVYSFESGDSLVIALANKVQ